MRYVDFFPQGTLQLPDGRIKDSLAGYQVLERAAKASDTILFIGGQDSWIYPAWGRGFTRQVVGVDSLQDAENKIKSKRFDFIIIEERAKQILRDASLELMKSSNYKAIYKNKETRFIYQRLE